jgi:hypothetical protein
MNVFFKGIKVIELVLIIHIVIATTMMTRAQSEDDTTRVTD